MSYEDTTGALRRQLDECKTPEEMLAVAKEAGYELSDEELADMASGGWNPVKEVLPKCPNCGSMGVSMFPLPGTGVLRCVCGSCKHVWTHTPVGDL